MRGISYRDQNNFIYFYFSPGFNHAYLYCKVGRIAMGLYEDVISETLSAIRCRLG